MANTDNNSDSSQSDTAANVIRQKIEDLYAAEPQASQEIAESQSLQRRSKHQQFMYELSQSGKDLATIQTEWHNYYTSLPDNEKHEVWSEFYGSQSLLKQPAQPVITAQQQAEHKHEAAHSLPHRVANKPRLKDARSAREVRSTIQHHVSAGGKIKAKHHVQSLLFGLAMGAAVVAIFLFGFFNEMVIAPFIQPSRTAAATPIIVTNSTVAATTTPEVIIPKINVEIPVVYTATSTNEADIENSLESGVVHYPTTSLPGENGNAAFFGHSSNNIFNKGKYKFAFVLLHTLVPGDTFYLTYNSKVYVYKVISKTVVEPTRVEVLGPVEGQTATATLITCDPPGTSLRRLVIVGQQISPDPSSNTAASATFNASQSTTSEQLPGNGPTLFSRVFSTAIGKIVLFGGGIAIAATLIWRFLLRPL